MSTLPTASVIVVNSNSCLSTQVILECVQAILELSYAPLRVVIIDNGSTDGSGLHLQHIVESYARKGHDVRLVRLPRNIGFAAANNLGFTLWASTSKYIALINSDLAPNPDSLRGLINYLERHSSVGGAQGKILTWDGRRIDNAGCYLSDVWHVLVRGRSRRAATDYAGAPVSYVDGAYSVYRAEAITKAGGLFIPDFFLYGDDYELAQRVWAAGYTLDYVTILAGRHLRGASIGHSKKEAVYYAHRGETGVMVLHDPFWFVKIIAYFPRLIAHIIAYENYATRGIIDGVGLGLKLRRRHRFRDSAYGPRVCVTTSDRLWHLLARLLGLPRGRICDSWTP